MSAQLKRWTPGLMLDVPNLQRLCAAHVPFYWKRAINSHLKLSPLDVNKDMMVWTYAAPSVGMAYIVCQWKNPQDESLGVNIIHCDFTTFKHGKSSYSPFEAELAALHCCAGFPIGGYYPPL